MFIEPLYGSGKVQRPLPSQRRIKKQIRETDRDYRRNYDSLKRVRPDQTRICKVAHAKREIWQPEEDQAIKGYFRFHFVAPKAACFFDPSHPNLIADCLAESLMIRPGNNLPVRVRHRPHRTRPVLLDVLDDSNSPPDGELTQF